MFTLGLFRLLGIVFVDAWDSRWIYNWINLRLWLQGIKFRNFVCTCGRHNLSDLYSKTKKNKRRGSDNVL